MVTIYTTRHALYQVLVPGTTSQYLQVKNTFCGAPPPSISRQDWQSQYSGELSLLVFVKSGKLKPWSSKKQVWPTSTARTYVKYQLSVSGK